MNPHSQEDINQQIKDHEASVSDWQFQQLAETLYRWHGLFNQAFFEFKLQTTVISFEQRRVNNFGHYVVGRNPIGVHHNINLNAIHVGMPLWRVLSTLVHEMVHQWETQVHQRRTGGWYHTKTFRKKLSEIGIACNHQGHHLHYDYPFLSFLEKHGVNVTEVEQENIRFLPLKGKSKLKKYQCGCPINVRVADSRFSATCNHCHQPFQEVFI